MAGRRPVEEAFAAGRAAIRLLVVPQRRQALERIVLHATNLRIPIVEVEGGTLTSLAGFDGHQGVAVVVPPRRYATLDEILARSIERGEPPFVLALDSLEDPQNVGTLLRSAEAAGVHGVVYPTHRQAPLTPAAVKASAGAVEHLLLCPVDDLAAALADLHVRGLRVAGAEADAPLTVRQADLRGPLALVVGSEGQGLGPAVRRRADLLMRIPMAGAIDSLNAAVAGSILLFEALAQRDPEGRAKRREPVQALPPEPVAPADDAGPQGTEPEGDTAPRNRGATRKAAEAAATSTHDTSTTTDAAGSAVGEGRDAPKPRARRSKVADVAAAPVPTDAPTAEPVPEPTAARTPRRRTKADVADTAADAAPPADAPKAPRKRRAKEPDAVPPGGGDTSKAEAKSARRRRTEALAAPPAASDDDDDLLPGGPQPSDAPEPG